MATLTLNLNPHEYYRLRDGLESEKHKWEMIKLEAEAGLRPNASPEGADILVSDCQGILDQLKAWADEQEYFVA